MTSSPSDPVSTAPTSTEAIRRALHKDATECWIAVKQADSPLRRRNYIRAVFAFADGFVSVMKRHALEEAAASRFSPSRAELALLLEEKYDLKENGEPRVRSAFPPALPNARFAFQVFARAHRIATLPDFGGDGWQAFQQALEVRHRITHPKATTDVEISDTELATVEKAHMWFLDSTFKVYVDGRGALMAELELARRQASEPAPE